MPGLVPPPNYNADTPDINEFYQLLADGLKLTLDEDAAVLSALDRDAGELDKLISELTDEVSGLKALEAQGLTRLNGILSAPPPRRGSKQCKADLAATRASLAEASAELEETIAKRRMLARGIELRAGLRNSRHEWQVGNKKVSSGGYGVYAFYDFDGVAMYVGKTTEGVSTRIRRHLTNQRTDAVAMGVLDPLEVVEVEVWPLWPPDHQKDLAREYVGTLEYAIERRLSDMLFNEKRVPPVADVPVLPASVRFDVLSPQTRARLGHPDLRIARRAAVAAKLSSRISERSLPNVGLRLSLRRQLQRLTELADRRFEELGGLAAVPEGTDSEGD
ncbi:GIY-YIG nuclease family protein [Micromonospora sp. NPDC049460]|uniref:GIY-YIG nuclease family protein n=1 Tax=Micromonospora sp. NPDC049460 TaxID=3364272 RepID=UPI0037B8E04A